MTFDHAIDQIKTEYKNLGHQLGYRFLLSSKDTFNSDVIFLNLNPGGDRIYPGQPADSCENGPAYLTESWGYNLKPGQSPLQIQVQHMLREISGSLPEKRDLLYDSMIAYFIPFRSPDLKSLHAKRESLEFAKYFWTQILSDRKPRLIICLGNEVRNFLLSVFNANHKHFSSPVGWGNVTAEIFIPDLGPSILKLPHLSRFRIFNRPESKPYVDDLIFKLTGNL